jgi:hypothetical protein
MSVNIPPPPTSVQEIEIFSTEQLNVLPEEARISIINLESNLPQKELMILNPLVSELLKIKELTKIEYVPLSENPTKEEIAAHKENIEEFKSAKKSITALTQQNSKAKSAIKGPLDLLGKQVLTIEKSVKSIADEVLKSIELTFKPYLDAEAEKSRIAKEKKEAAEKAAINTLSAENLAQANQFKKSQLITFLKYEMLNGAKSEMNTAIENYSLEKLIEHKEQLASKCFNDFLGEKELILLTQEEIDETVKFYNNEMNLFLQTIQIKINALQLEKQNEKLTEKVVQQTEQLEIKNTVLPPPLVSFIPPVPQGSIISNTDVFGLINQNEEKAFGLGAKRDTVFTEEPLYPKNSNEVDFLDLVIDQLNKCKENVQYITQRFSDDTNIPKDNTALFNIQKATASLTLLDKTIAYVQNPIQPVREGVVAPPPSNNI